MPTKLSQVGTTPTAKALRGLPGWAEKDIVSTYELVWLRSAVQESLINKELRRLWWDRLRGNNCLFRVAKVTPLWVVGIDRIGRNAAEVVTTIR